MPPRLVRVVAVMFAAMVGVVACSGLNSSVPGGTYQVTVPSTPFYRFGPMQNTGPDQILKLGQRVTLVSREYGYSRFKLAEGITGYAATMDFVYVPPTPKPVTATGGGRKKGRGKAPEVPVGKLDMGDVPAPDLPSGGEGEKPRFRMR